MISRLFIAVATIVAGTASHAHEPVVYSATLLGINEVGGVFDPDGFGTATATIDAHTGQVDWQISFANLATVVGAHIHTGATGSNGPVIINFPVPANLSGSGQFAGSLIDGDAMTISALNAANFYFNVHTNEFPGGAIRGQLAPIPEPSTYALMMAGLLGVAAARRHRSP